MAKFCLKCGEEVQETTKFCAACGQATDQPPSVVMQNAESRMQKSPQPPMYA